MIKRVKKIVTEREVALNNNYKIFWKNNPIAKIKKGKNYLSPKIEIIADEALDLEAKEDLLSFLICSIFKISFLALSSVSNKLTALGFLAHVAKKTNPLKHSATYIAKPTYQSTTKQFPKISLLTNKN